MLHALAALCVLAPQQPAVPLTWTGDGPLSGAPFRSATVLHSAEDGAWCEYIVLGPSSGTVPGGRSLRRNGEFVWTEGDGLPGNPGLPTSTFHDAALLDRDRLVTILGGPFPALRTVVVEDTIITGFARPLPAGAGVPAGSKWRSLDALSVDPAGFVAVAGTFDSPGQQRTGEAFVVYELDGTEVVGARCAGGTGTQLSIGATCDWAYPSSGRFDVNSNGEVLWSGVTVDGAPFLALEDEVLTFPTLAVPGTSTAWTTLYGYGFFPDAVALGAGGDWVAHGWTGGDTIVVGSSGVRFTGPDELPGHPNWLFVRSVQDSPLFLDDDGDLVLHGHFTDPHGYGVDCIYADGRLFPEDTLPTALGPLAKFTMGSHGFDAPPHGRWLDLRGMVLNAAGEPEYGSFRLPRAPGTTSCPGSAHGLGYAAHLVGLGDDSIAANDVELAAYRMPKGATALVLASTGLAAAPVGAGGGTLCLGGAIARLDTPVQASHGDGSVASHVDLGALGARAEIGPLAAGTTLHFQLWYAHPTDAPLGNLTNVHSLTLR